MSHTLCFHLTISHLKPFYRNSDSKEDAACQTDMWDTLCYGEDVKQECVEEVKGNGCNDYVTEKKGEISQTEAANKQIENTFHHPYNKEFDIQD